MENYNGCSAMDRWPTECHHGRAFRKSSGGNSCDTCNRFHSKSETLNEFAIAIEAVLMGSFGII
jgi:hypothetical protein